MQTLAGGMTAYAGISGRTRVTGEYPVERAPEPAFNTIVPKYRVGHPDEPPAVSDEVPPVENPENQRPLKILFFSHYFPPEGNAPASRVHEMCKRWVRDGHDVTVVTCAPNAPAGQLYPGYNNNLIDREEIDGINVVRVWTFLAANKGKRRRSVNFLTYLASATVAGMFVQRPDVVVATSPQFFCGWAGVLVSKLRSLPLLIEIRDIWPESIRAVGAIKKRKFLLRCLESLEARMYSAATHIVTVGDGYSRQLLSRGVPASKMSVVTNGVDRELFRDVTPDAPFRTHPQLAGKFVCAYVGTLGMACGLEVAIEAGKLLKARGRDDIRIALVGDGANREQLETALRASGLDNVVIFGRVDKARVPGILASVDACLVHLKKQPLFETVLPSKIFEAAGMARPIICGVKGCAADLVQQAGAGICIEPENAQQLADALIDLADHPARAKLYGTTGKAYVCKHYDRDMLSAKYVGVLRQTLAKWTGRLVRRVASALQPA